MDARERLKNAGLRVTAQRIAVLDALDRSPHRSARSIITMAEERLGSVSPQAVYDVLSVCTAAGLVRRIEVDSGLSLYETRAGDNHHHLYCRRCGLVRDVDCAVGERPCLTPSEDAGFALDEAEVVFRGLCENCQTVPGPPVAEESVLSDAVS